MDAREIVAWVLVGVGFFLAVTLVFRRASKATDSPPSFPSRSRVAPILNESQAVEAAPLISDACRPSCDTVPSSAEIEQLVRDFTVERKSSAETLHHIAVELEQRSREQSGLREAERVQDVVGEECCARLRSRLEAVGHGGLMQMFNEFDTNGNGRLSRSEFERLFQQEFGSDIVESTDGSTLVRLLAVMGTDRDDEIDLLEFEAHWRGWFSSNEAKRALIIIDVQNDFIDGSLALKNCPAGQDAMEVVPVINELAGRVNFDVICISLDWHPHEHCSFHESITGGTNPVPLHPSQSEMEARAAAPFTTVVMTAPDGTSPMTQVLWPRHCVQNTLGAACHKDLRSEASDVIVYKGAAPGVDSYSAFFDNAKFNQTTLLSELRVRGVTHVYLCGVAFDGECAGALIMSSHVMRVRSTRLSHSQASLTLLSHFSHTLTRALPPTALSVRCILRATRGRAGLRNDGCGGRLPWRVDREHAREEIGDAGCRRHFL